MEDYAGRCLGICWEEGHAGVSGEVSRVFAGRKGVEECAGRCLGSCWEEGREGVSVEVSSFFRDEESFFIHHL